MVNILKVGSRHVLAYRVLHRRGSFEHSCACADGLNRQELLQLHHHCCRVHQHICPQPHCLELEGEIELRHQTEAADTPAPVFLGIRRVLLGLSASLGILATVADD